MKGATKIDVKYIRQGKTNTAQIILDEVEIKSVVFFSKIDEKQGISSWLILTKASFETKGIRRTKRRC
jgi:carboxyl-terminal processing protease